eukprot:g71660.t1
MSAVMVRYRFYANPAARDMQSSHGSPASFLSYDRKLSCAGSFVGSKGKRVMGGFYYIARLENPTSVLLLPIADISDLDVKAWIREKAQLFKGLLFTYASYMRLFLRVSTKVPELSHMDSRLMGDILTEVFVHISNYGIRSEADLILVEVDMISLEERKELLVQSKSARYQPSLDQCLHTMKTESLKYIGLGELAMIETMEGLGGNLVVTRGDHGPEYYVVIPHHDGKSANINQFLTVKMKCKVEGDTEDTDVDCVEIEPAEPAEDPMSFPVAFVAHELRNPLIVLRSIGIDLAERPAYLNLEKVAADIEAITDFVSVFLDDAVVWTQNELGRIELEHVLFDLREFVEDLENQWKRRLHTMSKDVALNIFVEPDVPKIIPGDPTRLRQILWFLFANASKFTTKGSISLNVRVQKGDSLGKDEVKLIRAAPVKEDEVKLIRAAPVPTPKQVTFLMEFTSKDAGPTVEAYNFFKTLQPFTEIHNVGQAKTAMGLGMAIVAKLVMHMRGEISMSGPSDQGLSMRVEIPFQEAKPTEQQEIALEEIPPELKPEIKTAPLPCRMEVLVVEDNSTSARVMLARLSQYQGIQVIEARNGKQAVAMMAHRMATKKRCPDLIMMDLQMPIMDGYEATKKLCAMKCTSHIVGLRSLPATERRVLDFLSAGAMAYYTKPMSGSKLEEILKRFYKGTLAKILYCKIMP